MFAGAAREAVFSNPDVIQRVNADFVPVALKAGLVNNPPDDEEGLLYREIERSKLLPQGICVVNSAGKVLDWTLMFDDDQSVLAFFDHAKERFAKYPDAKKPVAAEVYQKFPSQKRKDVEESGNVLPVLDRHPEGKHCPAESPLREGTVAVRLFGRALDKDGKPVADTVRQEDYIEDRFNIAVETQEKLAKALADAGANRVTLPLELTRQWLKLAHMGVLDVQPLDNPGPGKGELKKCDFGATKVGTGKGAALWRVEGESEVFIDERMANGGPGDMHEVKLKWHGFIEMDGNRMTRLVLSAGGMEKLKFQSARGKDENLVAFLPGGHRIDMECGVRYGMIGEPVPIKKAKDGKEPRNPEEASCYEERMPAKIHKIQKELPAWVQKTGDKEKATALMQKLKEHLDAKNLGEAEKIADSILAMIGGSAQAAIEDIPEEARREIARNLHGPFMVFRDAVREELKLTDEQKEKLEEHLRERLPDIMQFFQSLEGLNGEEREKKLQAFRQTAQEKLAAVLKDTLKENQHKRLRQLELQQEGAFALWHGDVEIGKDLKVTDEQRKQFMAVVQEFQKQVGPLIKEAQSGGNPEQIRPKVMKLRKEHEDRIEALLTDAQKKQWKEMLGKPLALDE
ncbi:MAG TPA: hypothetical protein VMV69_08935 [Pirellulales bacterium]|nr:hypothetical protein [Pirellulales bacterium]